MTKRTFVLFLGLLTFIATASLSFQGKDIRAIGGNLLTENREASKLEFHHTYDDNEAILQADVSEWRENLNDLLRHRNSSFRFIGVEQMPLYTLNFGYVGPGVFRVLLRQVFGYRSIILPDYYCFLHRLCPF